MAGLPTRDDKRRVRACNEQCVLERVRHYIKAVPYVSYFEPLYITICAYLQDLVKVWNDLRVLAIRYPYCH